VTLLPIRVLGDPILRQETKPVTTITAEIHRLIDDMFETMYAARGIGLAAPQVGRPERLAVVDVDDEPMVLINPEVIESSRPTEKAEEGCLSIPDVYGDVERPASVRVRAMDRDGTVFEREATGLLARCMQHEIDHLHGKMFIDYMSVLKKRSAMSQWEKERQKYPGNVRVLTAEEIAEHHHRDEEL
jgi:peptide deformylase